MCVCVAPQAIPKKKCPKIAFKFFLCSFFFSLQCGKKKQNRITAADFRRAYAALGPVFGTRNDKEIFLVMNQLRTGFFFFQELPPREENFISKKQIKKKKGSGKKEVAVLPPSLCSKSVQGLHKIFLFLGGSLSLSLSPANKIKLTHI